MIDLCQSAVPRLSVVIPAYNMAGYLPLAVDSVLAQDAPVHELLVLDNASTDDTPQVMARYARTAVDYRRNSDNLGLAGNVGLGCALATGDAILFLGADDRLEPGFARAATTFLAAEPEVALVHGPAAWIDAGGRRFGGTGQAWPRLTPGREAMLGAFGRGFSFSTMVMRTAAIRATGPFDPRWQEVIDLWLFLRMCLAGNVGYLDQALVEYRVHDQAMSMPMYRDNLMFRRQMRAAQEAFAWPGATAAHRREAERQIARTAVGVLHMARAGGRMNLVRNLAEIARAVPESLTWAQTWARLGFGMLPAGAIAGLRQRRRTAAHAAAAR